MDLSYEDWKEQKEKEQRNLEIVKNAVSATGESDPETYTKMFHEDLDYWMIGDTPFSGPRNGVKEFQALYLDVFSYLQNGIPVEMDTIFASGDYVAVEFHGDAKLKSGEPYRNKYVVIWRFNEEGKCTEMREYLDRKA